MATKKDSTKEKPAKKAKAKEAVTTAATTKNSSTISAELQTIVDNVEKGIKSSAKVQAAEVVEKFLDHSGLKGKHKVVSHPQEFKFHVEITHNGETARVPANENEFLSYR